MGFSPYVYSFRCTGWTLVVLNCCCKASGTCADPHDKRGMRKHDAFVNDFVSVYVVICILFQS
jgi:hypothetical protein